MQQGTANILLRCKLAIKIALRISDIKIKKSLVLSSVMIQIKKKKHYIVQLIVVIYFFFNGSKYYFNHKCKTVIGFSTSSTIFLILL